MQAISDNPARAGWLAWLPVAALGLYTITSYGTWAYGFGVLIEAISIDTGWSTSSLGATFGVAMMLSGLLAFAAGRLLDRFGPLMPFAIHATIASGLLLAAFSVHNEVAFGVLYGIGGGLSGATGFYAMTTVMAARARPDRPDRAIAILTMIGALCSPIYLPLTAWLLTLWHWRTVGRALVVAGVVGAVLAAIATRLTESQAVDLGTPAPSANPFSALAAAIRVPSIRRMLAVYALAGAAASTVWVYQVPIMAGTGLALRTAGVLGGLRGFCQLFGRMGLTAAVERFGSGALLRGAYLTTAIGSTALLASGLGWFGASTNALAGAAVCFAVLGGVGLGASSPLQAIYSRSLFDPADLGLLMGMQGAVLGLAGGAGPFIGALLRDATGGWSATVGAVIVALLIGGVLLRPGYQPPVPGSPLKGPTSSAVTQPP